MIPAIAASASRTVRLADRIDDLRDGFLASDPGLIRLRTAARTTLTVALVAGVLFLIATATEQPAAAVMLGSIFAQQSSLVVTDPDSKGRLITTLLLILPASAAVALAAFLAGAPIVGHVGVVAVVFAGVYARRFGPRWTSFGMVAFWVYLFAIFFAARPAQLPWLLTALALGTLCTALMRFVVLPDRPEAILRRLLDAFAVDVRGVVDAAADVLQDTDNPERHRRRLRAWLRGLHECTLMVEAELPRSTAPDDPLALAVLDTRLAAERLAVAASRTEGLPATARLRAIDALRDVQTSLQAEVEPLTPPSPFPPEECGTEDPAAWGLWLAITDLARTASALRLRAIAFDPAAATRRTPPGPCGGRPDRTGSEARPDGLPSTTRQAVQAALATALALLAGELISPERGVWAVIAAFVMFIGTGSRGHILVKGWQSIVGTLAGVVAGVVTASAVGGSTTISVALIFACIFLVSHLVRVNYALAVFWITTMLGLLYGLMGQFSVDLLLVRLAETAVGAAAGGFAAFLVLPAGTRWTVRAAAVRLIDRIDDLVAAAVPALAGTGQPGLLRLQAYDVERALQALHEAARPLSDGIGALGFRNTRRRLATLAACAYYAREFAQSAVRARLRARTLDGADAETLRQAAAGLKHNLQALRAIIAGAEPPPLNPAGELLDTLGATLARSMGDRQPEFFPPTAAVRALARLDRLILDLARDLGVGTRRRSGA